ncbi:hypothetical protein [Agromyces cerinus]|uniref:Uncharacterized protein n=1 Tax=Agromyces cerinus subsp. cerinus TaxID=232089 RepID=A0A1N6F5S1_9MICO|nr:hypothetical protein [Agromyces cerinus]SIN90554.1 hypothetical protein SAMN05443544_1765 [Agromyces cerinus subsp. cerinus]
MAWTTRRILIAVGVSTVVILAVAVTLDRLAADGGAADPSSVATDGADAPGTATGPNGDDSAAGASEPPGSSGDDGNASEVLPPLEPMSGLPDPVVPTPFVSSPLPPDAAVSGGLVDGFPAGIAVYEASEIVSSSVSSAGEHLQATLAARTEAGPQAVLDFYSQHFGSLGLTSTIAPAVGGSRALSFANGGDSLVVTVTGGSAGTDYTVFATLTAQG